MSKNYKVQTIKEAIENLQNEERSEYLAGGVDVQDRINIGLEVGDTIDINNLDELKGIDMKEKLQIGALSTLSDLLNYVEHKKDYLGLAEAIKNIANPQIRNTATVGGNLLQRNRCWYFRNPNFKCLKNGGDKCYARKGENQNHAIFSFGSCVSVHPSTLGMVFLAYDAECLLDTEEIVPIKKLFGDGSNSQKDNELDKNRILKQITLDKTYNNEISKYFRLTKRQKGEWPTVEVFVRLEVENTIKNVAVCIGAVAPIPLRMHSVEDFLIGKTPSFEVVKKAAEICIKDTAPLAKNEYKVEYLKRSLIHVLCDLLQIEVVLD